MKPPAIALSGAGRGLEKGDGRGHLTNVQCEAIGNWHNESPLYNDHMLIKMKKRATFHFLKIINLVHCKLFNLKSSFHYRIFRPNLGKLF
jgi:hypothetical protein